MNKRNARTGDVLRRYTGELAYVNVTGLICYYTTFVENGAEYAIPRRAVPGVYKVINKEVDAASRKACTTDCPMYRNGVCPYFGRRKVFCIRVRSILQPEQG